MDLKFKKPKWVGSIYHTFEAICHEVDDFVSQESVKFVENQAQTVGSSVKRLYCNVVQDLLPNSTQHGNHEDPILSLEQNYKGIEEKGVHIVVNDENYDLSLGSEIKDSERDNKCDVSSEEIDPTGESMGENPSIFEENELRGEQMNANANNVDGIDSKEEPPEAKEMDLFSPDNMDVSEASFISNIPEVDSTCDVYVCVAERISDISKSLPPLEMKFPVVSSDNMTVESGIVSSNSSPFSSEIVDVLHNEENTDVKLNPSSSAFDEDSPSADDIAALVTSFEDNKCNDYAHLEALMSFLKVGKEDECMIDITDPSMVTIELTDDTTKLDESSVLAENKLLYGVFHRSWKNKSYKKILQDAFASRKRLRKEYEQLGILFGDMNIETPKRQEHNLLPESPSSSLGSGELPSSDLSEWEIL